MVEKNNPEYINGITGYERYYTDLDGFWRELYVPEPIKADNDIVLNENNFYTIDLTDPKIYFDKEKTSEKNVIKRNIKIDGTTIKILENGTTIKILENQEYDIKSFNLEN